MKIHIIDRKSMDLLLAALKEAQGHIKIEIDCGGGDACAAMKFVNGIKKNKLEGRISLHIIRAESAAAYIALSLNCYRSAEEDSVITIHGGHIEGELHELILSGIWKHMFIFFRDTSNMVKKIATPEHQDIFSASGIFTLSREEIEKAGIKFI